MSRVIRAVAVAAVLLFASEICAQQENPLSRDEVAVVKKKLVNIFDALGQPPAGYSIERENYNLPTEAYKNGEGNLYNLLSASAQRTYGTQKKAEKETSDLSKEYQKKFAEAQASGDYAALSTLAQEMQQKAGEAQLKAVQERKEPVRVDVSFNSNPGATIDPDAVLFERAGVIALKTKDEGSADQERLHVYFDPVSLKDTKQLSRVDMKTPDEGIAKRTTVLNVTVEFDGPTNEVEAWAKGIDVSKILAQIDAAK